MRRTALATFGLLAWVACGLAERGHAEAVSFPVRFETEDGFTLHGDLVSAADVRAPVAILLHMYRSDRSAWAALVPALTEAGLTVLAIDQRAHGASTRKGGQTLRVGEIPRERFGDWVRQGPRDVAAARAFLARRGLAVDRLALVGASYGCSVALLSAGTVDGVRALALLSPGDAYFGVDVTEAAHRFPGPLLAVAARDDPQAARSVARLTQLHEGPDEAVVYDAGGHGTHLLARREELAAHVARFLRDSLVPAN